MSSKDQPITIEAVIASDDDDLAADLPEVVHELWDANIHRCRSLSETKKRIADSHTDLLLFDLDSVGVNSTEITRHIRHGELGSNPFVIVVSMVTRPDPGITRRIIDSGSDDLISMPAEPEEITERLSKFMTSRKKFVVTTAYTGPDRRAKDRPGERTPLIDAPNPLSSDNTGSAGVFRRLVAETAAILNDEKVERLVFQTDYLVGLISQDYLMAEREHEIDDDLESLLHACQELAKRISSSKYAYMAGLPRIVLGVVERIWENREKPDPKDFALLPEITQAMNRALEIPEDAAGAIRDIEALIENRDD